MKDEHIISVLEGAPLGSLSEHEQALIRDHIDRCDDCRRAHHAARISGRLLTERVAVTVEPSPFFQTRVLTALRERQTPQPLRQMWKSAGWLVSSMAATVVLLAALTLFTPSSPPPSMTPELVSSSSLDSAEQVIFASDETPDDNITYSQVLTALYQTEDDLGGSDEQRR